jgi:hypothetical protein
MRILRLVIVGTLLISGAATAQEPEQSSPSDRATSREENSYRSPREESARQAIARRAAWKAAQRQQRLEAYKWLGYSPSRPPASPMQFMGGSPRAGYAYRNFPGMVLPHYVLLPR